MITVPRASGDMHTRTAHDQPGVGRWSQQRLEQSRAGRALISFGLALTVTAWLVAGMPQSHIKSHIAKPFGTYLAGVGLDQSWGVFAPFPQNTSISVDGKVDFADGTSSQWRVPESRGLTSVFVYHWQKFSSSMRLPTYSYLRPRFAQYIADRERESGKDPVRVTLVLHAAPTLPPGPWPARKPWTDVNLYVLDLKGAK